MVGDCEGLWWEVVKDCGEKIENKFSARKTMKKCGDRES